MIKTTSQIRKLSHFNNNLKWICKRELDKKIYDAHTNILFRLFRLNIDLDDDYIQVNKKELMKVLNEELGGKWI